METGRSSNEVSNNVFLFLFPKMKTILSLIPLSLRRSISLSQSFRIEYMSMPLTLVFLFFSTLMAEAPISSLQVSLICAFYGQFLQNDFHLNVNVCCNDYLAVYALWKVPNLLPSFELKGGEVSRYIIGGADLMFPGINISPEDFPSFSAGQPWAVRVPGNPAPIAVTNLNLF